MPMKNMKKKAPIVIGVLVGIIGIASFGILPISITAIIGVSCFTSDGCLKAS